MFMMACSNPKKVLPKKNGLWNYTATTVSTNTFAGSSSTTTTVRKGVAFFNDTNGGSMTLKSTTTSYSSGAPTTTDECDDNDCTSSFTWYYNNEAETIHLDIWGDFKVETAKGKEEVWKNSYSSTGGTSSTSITNEVKLERLK